MARLGISEATRQLVVRRARGLCEYCRCPESHSLDTFALEHVTPRARGGSSDAANLALSCQGCNGYKGARTHAYDAVSERDVPLFHSRTQNWAEHFAWSEDGLFIVGLTPIGRATSEALKLNRFGVVNLRRLLAGSGLHPP